MKKSIFTAGLVLVLVLCVSLVCLVSLTDGTDNNVASNAENNIELFLGFEQAVIEMNNDQSIENSDADNNISDSITSEDEALPELDSPELGDGKNEYAVDGAEVEDFSLKRLIVQGDIKDTYGAQKKASYNNLHILSYATIQDTEFAYNNLKADSSLDVFVDKEQHIEEYAEKEYDYSDNINWGARAIDGGGYRQYLLDNKSAKTDREVVVAILDTGINTSHPMFEGRLLTDENGKIKGYSYGNSSYQYSYGNLAFDEDDTNKYSFEDDHSHGTHVAGIVASL
ncbi:MAG: S8 family serine peptidase, partial [Clostridia bacterium]|nr:S8 family serine peptidase [Clostridia bacterium]